MLVDRKETLPTDIFGGKVSSFIRYGKNIRILLRNKPIWSLVHCIFKFCGDFLVHEKYQTGTAAISSWALQNVFVPNARADGEGLTLQGGSLGEPPPLGWGQGRGQATQSCTPSQQCVFSP